MIPEFEKAFGASFGVVPVKAGPPPAMTVDLVPLKEPNCSDGFILERDDVVRFAMPIQVPILHLFPKAPSQNVWIAVKFFDGTEQVVLRGLRIQHTIADLIEQWGEKKQTLNVQLEIGLRTTSAVLPGNVDLIGKRNPNPLIYLPDGTPEHIREQLEGRAGTTTLKFPVYALLRADDSRAVMLPTPDGLLLPIFSTLDIANEVKGQATIEVRVVELRTHEELSLFVENPPGRPSDAPDFNILFDSVDPHERKQGLVNRKEFLTSRPRRPPPADSGPKDG